MSTQSPMPERPQPVFDRNPRYSCGGSMAITEDGMWTPSVLYDALLAHARELEQRLAAAEQRAEKAEGEVTHMRIGWGDFLKQFGIVASVGAPGGFVNERAEAAEKELTASPTLWLNRALEAVSALYNSTPTAEYHSCSDNTKRGITQAESAIKKLLDEVQNG